MFCIYLLRFIFATTSADLEPPFELDSERKVGYWEFGGSSIVQSSVIMIAPPVQYNKGYVWTNVEIPAGSWSLTYKLQIHSGTGGGGFGLWFVDKYGASGPLHGGPTSFSGISVLGTVNITDKEQDAIDFNIIQSSGKDNYGINNLPKPDSSVPLDRSRPFYVFLEFNSKNLKIYYSKTESKLKETLVYSGQITVDIRDTYIGITAQSDAYTSRFDLYSINFGLGLPESDNEGQKASSGGQKASSGGQRTASFGSNAPSGHYQPETKSILRNPAFQTTLKELQVYLSEANNENREATSKVVLDVINEMNFATTDVASFKELNSFVTQTLMPYSQKWHRRTLKIVEQVQQARNVMGAAWNFTHEMIQNMNSTMRMNSVKTTFKVIDMAELLTNEAESASEGSNELTEQPGLIKFLVNGAIVEFSALVIFFFLVQFNSIKEKIFGPSI